MEPNLAGRIYVRSSIKFLRFIPFGQQIWLSRAILVSDWLMLKKSSPLKLLGQIKPILAGSIYVRSSIKLLHLVPFGQQTRPPRLILFSDWQMLKKSSPLKQLGHMEPNLAGTIYVRSKPGIDGPWVCPFQNCVRQTHPPFKMAAVFKVMIISRWNLLQYHSIVRWAIQAQWTEPLVSLVNISKAKLFIVDLKTPWLVYTNSYSINGLEMDTWINDRVISHLYNRPMSVDYHFTQGYLYWTSRYQDGVTR